MPKNVFVFIYKLGLLLVVLWLTACTTVGGGTPPLRPRSVYHWGKLAYVQQGDLWVKDMPGGEARCLTTDAASGRGNFTPRWSPSGAWLAFRKTDTPPGSWQRRAKGDVWLAQAAGPEVYRVPATGEVQDTAWSPLHDELAYVDADGLHVITAAGATVRTLVATPATTTHISTFAWGPDGDWLAYGLTLGGPPGVMNGEQGVWKVPATSGEAVKLYDSGYPVVGAAFVADWTHDGRYILFWQGNINSTSMLADGVPLFALPSAGGTPMPLVPPLIKDAAVLFYPQSVAVAPVGGNPTHVALSLGGGRETLSNKQVGVAVIGGEFVALSPPEQSAIAVSWSPDGTRLAYTAATAQAAALADATPSRLRPRRIYTVDMDGHVQQLTHDSAYRDEYPRWSAGSDYLLFPRLNEQNVASLWLVAASGGTPIAVVETLSPLAESSWAGYYGYVEWGHLFDWWRGGGE